MEWKWLVFIWFIGINAYTFFLYAADKKRAAEGSWRIPEKRLLMSAWMGGAWGANLGMYFFHHKTRHRRFRIEVPMASFAWGILIILMFLRG